MARMGMTGLDIETIAAAPTRRGLRRPGGTALVTSLTAAGVLALAPIASAAVGGLDTSFGPAHDGTVLTAIGAGGKAMATAAARQSDGKIVVAGTAADHDLNKFTLARYNADGTLDHDFGSGGIVMTAIGNGKTALTGAVLLEQDGKILLTGSAADDGETKFALARYLYNGALDTTFGAAGVVLTQFGAGSNATATAAALQPDGKIVAAGSAVTSAGAPSLALVRYTSTGALDTTFGNGGAVLTQLTNAYGATTAISALALAPDGRMVVAGSAGVGGAGNSGSQSAFVLARYTPAGVLDATFGTGGVVVSQLGSAGNSGASSLLLRPNGEIVAGGLASDNGQTKFALAAYNAAGVPDPAFGSGGRTLLSVGDGGSAALVALTQAPDGEILAVGTALDGRKRGFAVERLSPTGVPDNTFGSGGGVFTRIGIGSLATSAVLQPDGKLIAVGTAVENTDLKFAMARYDAGH